MRKTVRVERMDVKHGHALGFGRCAPGAVMQGMDLHAGAAITLDTVASAADDQKLLGIGCAIQHHVHGQGLAVATGQGVKVRVHLQARVLGSAQEFFTGLRVAFGKAVLDVVHSEPGQADWVGLASHCVASSTQ